MNKIKKLLLPSLILLILLSSFPTHAKANAPETGMVVTEQLETAELTGFSRPILVSVSDSTSIRERNDTLGFGAIDKGTLNSNVTITYKVVNGINGTSLKLYADLPGNYSLTNSSETADFTYVDNQLENFTLPYDPSMELINANVSYYELELNMTVDFIPYYAKVEDTSEDEDDAPRNLLTTKQYWKTYTTEEFFTNDENVTISLTANDTAVDDEYGLRYKTIEDSSYTKANFTLQADGPNSISTYYLDIIEEVTTVSWYSVAYLRDTVLDTVRTISRIDFQTIDVSDATPIIETNLASNHTDALLMDNYFYSQNGTLNITLSGSIAKGNITGFSLQSPSFTQDVNITAEGNVSIAGEATYAIVEFDEGTHNLTIFALSSKGLIANDTYTVIIDTIIPVISLNAENVVVTGTNEEMTFIFSFLDAAAGVREASLDFGDNSKVEVTNLDTISHVYVGINVTTLFTVTLTVVDWAGNVASTDLPVTVVYDDDVEVTAADYSLELIIFGVVVVLIILSPRFIPPILERFK